MSAHISMPGKAFANALKNAVTMATEPAGRRTLEHVLISFQPNGRGGALLTTYGVSPHAAGRTIHDEENPMWGEGGSVSITLEQAKALEKVVRSPVSDVTIDIFDDPTEVQVRHDTGQVDQHGATIYSHSPQVVNLLVEKVKTGDQIATLLDSDPERVADRYFDWVDDMLAEAPEAPVQLPVMLAVDTLAKFKPIESDNKGGSIGATVDIARSKHDRIYRMAMGSTFRGLIADVGREIYAEGGPWGTGLGGPSHLLD